MPTQFCRASVLLSLCCALARASSSLLSLDAPVVSLFSGAAPGVTAAPEAPGGGWLSAAFADVPEHSLFPEFLDLDLGACGDVASVVLFANASSADGFPIDFSVFVADVVRPRWRQALAVTNATPPAAGGSASFTLAAGAQARFVRLAVTRVSGGLAAGAWRWAALRRLQVWGPSPSPSACPAADPSWPPLAPWPPACAPAVGSVAVEGLAATTAGAAGPAAAIVVDTPAPRISWTLTACERGQRITAFRVTVGSAPGLADTWDSGTVPVTPSDDDTGVAYGGAALRAATRYFAAVWLTDASGRVTAAPANASFLTAKLSPLPAAWTGSWIGTGQPSAHRGVYLRSSFALPAGRGAVERAVATFCGLGYGELTIDGVKLGDMLLAPGWTQYNKRTQYLTFEVEPAQLAPGSHEIGILLGDGWYSIEHDPWVHHLEDAVYVSTPKALLDLEVTFADGSRALVCTGIACNATTAPWQWSYGEITRAWIGAENIDARLVGVRDWQPAAVVQGPNEQFLGALLVAQVELPTRVQGPAPLAPQLHNVSQAQPEPYIGGGAFGK